MTSALEEACSASRGDKAPCDFSYELNCAITCFQRGGISRNTLVLMTRSREMQTAHFCMGKLGNLEVDDAFKAVLYLLIQQPGVFLHFADLLMPESDPSGKHTSPRSGLYGNMISFPVGRNHGTAGRCLSALRKDERFTFPLLFGMLQTGNEEIQSKTSRLAQKLRLDFVHGAYLLLHSPARLRAAALEEMLGQRAGNALPYYRLCVCDPEPQVRAIAALGLCRSGDTLGLKLLVEMSAHPDCEIRSCAIAVLMRFDTSSMLSMLNSVHWAPDSRPRVEPHIM